MSTIAVAGIVPQNSTWLEIGTTFLGSTYLGILILNHWSHWSTQMLLATLLPILASFVRIISTLVMRGENLFLIILDGHYPTLFVLQIPVFLCVGMAIGGIWEAMSKQKSS